jgi:hypothetical protein
MKRARKFVAYVRRKTRVRARRLNAVTPAALWSCSAASAGPCIQASTWHQQPIALHHTPVTTHHSQLSTRDAQSSRNPSKLLKIKDRVLFYPRRFASSLRVRFASNLGADANTASLQSGSPRVLLPFGKPQVLREVTVTHFSARTIAGFQSAVLPLSIARWGAV